MTQTGPAAQHDVLLPHGWSEANRADSLLFQLDGLELHLIPGSSFEDVADAVGTLRNPPTANNFPAQATPATSTAATRHTTI